MKDNKTEVTMIEPMTTKEFSEFIKIMKKMREDEKKGKQNETNKSRVRKR